MRPQKQLINHDPANGKYGDCHRTAIACILDMDAKDVPHFMDRTSGKGDAPEESRKVREWLLERDLIPINVLYPGSLRPEEIMETILNSNYDVPGIAYILGGTSRTGVNHSVVCCNGKIACDPSQKDSGIIGPMDDNYYWVTFFGSTKSLHQETAK